MRINTFTIPALFSQAVERTPEKDAIIDLETDERLTYGELREEVNAVANGLHRRGVEKGDYVAICLKNRPEHCITFLACQELGAVAVPFNFRLKAEGIEYTLADAEPTAFVFGDTIAETVSDLYSDVAVDTFVHVGERTPSFATPFDDIRAAETDRPDVTVTPDDLSVIQYSSGTTGDPKGVELDQLASASRVVLNAYGQQFRIDGETMLGVMPLYHTVGLHGILCSMLALSGTYLCQPNFDPERCVDAISEYDVTALHEAPTIFKKLVEADGIDEYDLESVRVLTYSGAPMDSTLMEQVTTQFDPDYLSNQYGCTEAYGPLGQLNLLDDGEPTETGPANFLQATRIVELESNDPDAVVEQGTEGELIVSMESPIVFSGYHNKPRVTDAAIHDGWFFTGDVAYETSEGRTVITGRSDDMIISGGENIYPAEVEDEIAAHPAVLDVGVIGIDDDTWGEIPKAYVVCDEDVDEETLDQWCKDSSSLPDFKRPRRYEFLESLPRNASGKILRYKLRSQ
ncbi:class I adenylate-forming enzyme family protein [Natrarchaeobius chitinivorans]|uniref:Long-chain fatty acid--CoA ligase n=1 Tax=Natrarchaeobius chitinivorans TaxID=1679083 RepID=A0A3N6M320_NATCH|nr:class I adenylate-forming enzyme family protein [Natrarchaeobius chitinivorans]RQG94834.1 long-chain fatty acid--CoA ligase [Natrarchaeobius chitinivorans]